MAILSSGQAHENDAAAVVIVCKPSLSKAMGALHPAAALYDKPVNLHKASAHHASLVKILKANNVTVHELHDVLEDIDGTPNAREELEQLAAGALEYRAVDGDGEPIPGYWVSEEYKQSVLGEMTTTQLVDVVLTNPTVTVTPSYRDTGVAAAYTFQPLSNILFCRDQQITTRRGIVMARPHAPQRAKEVDILEFALRKLKLNVIGRVPAPGHLEGGDFFPVGPNLSLIGVGPRTDFNAVQYLMREDLFGTSTVAVVKDELEASQQRMHLDTIFNIVGESLCVLVDDVIGEDSPKRRVVDVYTKANGPTGLIRNMLRTDEYNLGWYTKERSDMEFSQFLTEQGFHIIQMSDEDQLNYGCNLLNLGNGNIIATDKIAARKIESHHAFDGKVHHIDFQGVTAMYGGVHCATQVVQRHKSH